MALLVYYVRHGHAENNDVGIFPDDENYQYKLTEKGLEQVKEIADFLSPSKAEAIFTSPVYRAKETAEIIARNLSLKVFEDYRLKEVELGTLKNRPVKEIFQNDPNWYYEYFEEGYKYGLEKYSKIRERMLDFVKEKMEQGYSKIIAVSHLEPIRAMVTLTLKVSPKDVRKIEIHNASVTALKFESKENLSEPRILCINCLPLTRIS